VFEAQDLLGKGLWRLFGCDVDMGLAEDGAAIKLGCGLVDGAAGLGVAGL
jgi:hypothetical protein